MNMLVRETTRPLGAMERAFWLVDQKTPVHFATAAVIGGADHSTNWRRALERVQMRHFMLRARIDASHGSAPRFTFASPGAPIPLRVVETGLTGNWPAEVGAELARPFDPLATPLLRAVVLQAPGEAALILIAHHAIADGMSMAFVVRDLLEALGGTPLKPLSCPPSQDEFLARDATGTSAADAQPPALMGPAPMLRTPDGILPKIHAMRLEPGVTSALRERTQREKSSVQGALCAALVIAGRRDLREWRRKPVRVLSPISTRSMIGVGEDCGVFVDSVTTRFDVNSDSFWETARQATASVAARRNRANAAATTSLLQAMLLANSNVATVSEFAKAVFAREAMVTNLGVLPFPGRFGKLRLEAIWGPMQLAGLVDEHNIGAATLDGALHLTYATHVPNSGLLAAMRRELLAAIAP